MKIYRSLEHITIPNAVLTIGTFDGVHKGHQTIIKRINDLAADIRGESVILTFHPHPRLIIQPDDKSLKLLNTLEEKIELLENYGVNNLIITPFSKDFSLMTAEAYVKDFLWKNIRPKKIIIGYDHRFGNNREGGIDTFKQFQEALGFEVEEIEKQLLDDIAVSSTKVRQALQIGNISVANQLLGHYYSIEGTVVHGEKMGRKLGFPTANIEVKDENKLVPQEGIYAVKAHVNDKEYKAMLYIGKKPTFRGISQTIEVNIFDFEEDIYGKVLKVTFVDAIRSDIKFDTVDALMHQMKKDKERSLAILNN